jgi:hypothetical protein
MPGNVDFVSLPMVRVINWYVIRIVQLGIGFSMVAGSILWLLSPVYSPKNPEWLALPLILFTSALAGISLIYWRPGNWWGRIGGILAVAGSLLILTYQATLAYLTISASWAQFVLGFELLGGGLLLFGGSLVMTGAEKRGLPFIALGIVALLLIYAISKSVSPLQGTLITTANLLFSAGWLWLGLSWARVRGDE